MGTAESDFGVVCPDSMTPLWQFGDGSMSQGALCTCFVHCGTHKLGTMTYINIL